MYKKIYKTSIFLTTLILIFVCVCIPYYKALDSIDINSQSNKHILYEKRNMIRGEEHQCRYKTITSRPVSEISKYVSGFFSTDIEKKQILSEEFAAIVVKPKFRPQSARRNITDGNKNKCLLLKVNNDIIKKGDFVVFL